MRARFHTHTRARTYDRTHLRSHMTPVVSAVKKLRWRKDTKYMASGSLCPISFLKRESYVIDRAARRSSRRASKRAGRAWEAAGRKLENSPHVNHLPPLYPPPPLSPPPHHHHPPHHPPTLCESLSLPVTARLRF